MDTRMCALFVAVLAMVINLEAEAHCVQGTWHQAESCCIEATSHLPRLKSYRQTKYLTDQMHENRYISVWLPYRRILLKYWTWVDGTMSKNPLNDSPGKNCGFLNVTTGIMQESECGAMLGYLCEKKGCTTCNSLTWGAHICVQIDGSCFVPVCDWNSWYNARATCADSDMDLALMTSPASFKYLTRCDSYWIGVRKEIWRDTEDSEITMGLWGYSQPTESGNCSMFSRSDDEFHIEASACGHQASILCVRNEPTSTDSWFYQNTVTDVIIHPSVTTGDQEFGTSAGMDIAKWIAVGVGIPVGVSIVFLVGCLLYRRWKIHTRSRSSEAPGHKQASSRYRKVPMREKAAISTSFQTQPTEKEEHLRLLLAETQRTLFENVELWSWQDEHVTVQLDDLYVDLVLVRESHTSQMPRRKRLASYTQMFTEVQSHRKGNLFFLQGDAGMGKTTLAYKVSLDWSNSHFIKNSQNNTHANILKKFKYIVLLVLRDVRKGQKLGTVLKDQLSVTEKDATDLAEQFQSNQKSTLLVLDGYDEFKEDWSSEITEIAHRKRLPYVNILVTSRHSFSFHFGKTKVKPDVYLILNGFTAERVREYINNFFVYDLSVGKSLFEEIVKHNDYIELSRCPAFLLLMSVLWRDQSRLPSSTTGFYKEFLKYLLGRYERKHLSAQECTAANKLLEKYHNNLMKIAQVANSGLTEDGLVLYFTNKDVVSKIEEAWEYGIFNHGVCYNGAESKLYFLHKTFQEFFISYFLVHADPATENDLWLHLCESRQALRDANMIVKFVSGLGKDAIAKKLETLSSGSLHEVAALQTSLQINCLSENKDATMGLPRVVNLQVTESHSVNTYVDYLKMNGQQLEELILQVYELEHARLLQYVDAPRLTYIRLLHNPDVVSVEKSYISQTLESAISKISIEELEIGGFDLTRGESCQSELFSIFNAIHHSRTLQTVVFTVATLSDLQVRELSKAILASNIKTLALRKCEAFTMTNLEDIISVLPDCPNLKYLDVSGNSLGDEIQCLVRHTDKLENLEVLNVTQNQVSADIGELISKKFKRNIPTLSVILDDDLKNAMRV